MSAELIKFSDAMLLREKLDFLINCRVRLYLANGQSFDVRLITHIKSEDETIVVEIIRKKRTYLLYVRLDAILAVEVLM